ncbi:MAG: asparagine synthase-related protein, partial [Chloroflexota bacterium]
ARDHHGHTALYYYIDSKICAFAYSKKAILALSEIPRRLNETRLAHILTRWQYNLEHTLYEGIFHLLSANTLIVTPERVEQSTYWFPEDLPPRHFKSQQDYAEGLLDVLQQAVRSRLRSHQPVSISLSGGLDSGSVAALAAAQLKIQGQSLRAFTSVPYYRETIPLMAGRVADETPWVEAIAKTAGNIDVHYLPSRHIGPLTANQKLLDLAIEPDRTFGNGYWLTDMYQQANQQGFGTLLTGGVGNLTVSWAGDIASLPARHLLRLGAWKQLLRYKLLRPLLPPQIEAWHDHWRSQSSLEDHFTFMNAEFIQRVNLKEAMKAADYTLTFTMPRHRNPQQQRWNMIQPRRDSRLSVEAEISAGFNLDIRDPTLDTRVIEYCATIPDAVYRTPNGEARSLIRQALAGRLPTKVLENQTRGFQAIDLSQRLRHDHLAVKAAFAKIEDIQGYIGQFINVSQLQTLWQTFSETSSLTFAHHIQADTLLHKLTVALCLVRFQQGDS